MASLTVRMSSPSSFEILRKKKRLKTSPHILPRGNCFKMIRIYTCAVATEVIDLQSLRDWALVQFVGEAVRAHLPRSIPKTTIPFRMEIRSPSPAF